MNTPSVKQIQFLKSLWRQRELENPPFPKPQANQFGWLQWNKWTLERWERLATLCNNTHRCPSSSLRYEILTSLINETVLQDSKMDKDIFSYLISKLKHPNNYV
jgi:hypothetical protein